MKAEYEPFNSTWLKDCSKCGAHYGANTLEELSVFFTKDKSKVDGYDYCCKKCKAEYRNKNSASELRRWKAYYTPGSNARKRHMIRSQTRRKYGSAKNMQCQLCLGPAQEWHHLTYTTDDAVPVCEKCHEAFE